MCSRSSERPSGASVRGVDCTLIQRLSNHFKTVSLVRQLALRGPPTGFTRLMASRFMSRSMVAYRFVVVGLACPSHWLIVDRSTPDFKRATAVLWRMLCG